MGKQEGMEGSEDEMHKKEKKKTQNICPSEGS